MTICLTCSRALHNALACGTMRTSSCSKCHINKLYGLNPMKLSKIDELVSRFIKTVIDQLEKRVRPSEADIKERKNFLFEEIQKLLKADSTLLSRTDIYFRLPAGKTLPNDFLEIKSQIEVRTGLPHIACFLQDVDLIEVLSEVMNIYQQDDKGMTPLHYLALSCTVYQEKCLRIILSKSNTLPTNVLNKNGHSAFSLLDQHNGNGDLKFDVAYAYVAIELAKGLILSDYDFDALLKFRPDVFIKFINTRPDLKPSSVQEKLINLILEAPEINTALLFCILDMNKDCHSEIYAKGVFKLLSTTSTLQDFFIGEMEFDDNEKDFFTETVDTLVHIQNNPNLYLNLRDLSEGNNILHIILIGVSNFSRKIDLINSSDLIEEVKYEGFKNKVEKYIVPLLDCYSQLLEEKNAAGHCPILTGIKQLMLTKSHKLDHENLKLLRESGISSKTPKVLIDFINPNTLFFIHLIAKGELLYKLVKSLYINNQKILAELMYPLNPASMFIYPELVRAINEYEDIKPTNLLLSAMQLQLALACYQLSPVYIELLKELTGCFLAENEINFDANLFTNLPLETLVKIYSDMEALTPATLLEFRMSLGGYIRQLAAMLITLENTVATDEQLLSLQIDLNYKKTLLKKLIHIIGPTYKEFVRAGMDRLAKEKEKLLKKGEVFKQQLPKVEAEVKSYEYIIKVCEEVAKEIEDEIRNKNPEQIAWYEWKEKNFSFIVNSYKSARDKKPKQIASYAWKKKNFFSFMVGSYRSENDIIDTKFDCSLLVSLVEDLRFLERNCKNLILIFKDLYEIDAPIPSNLNLQFKKLFKWKQANSKSMDQALEHATRMNESPNKVLFPDSLNYKNPISPIQFSILFNRRNFQPEVSNDVYFQLPIQSDKEPLSEGKEEMGDTKDSLNSPLIEEPMDIDNQPKRQRLG